MYPKVIYSSMLLAALACTQIQTRWGQCGGDEYTGPATCPTGFICTYGNYWYSQCVPPEALENNGDDFTWIPDQPIRTQTAVTTVTFVTGGPIAPPVVVTTYITFITPDEPKHTSTTTITLIPDTPITPRPRPRSPQEERKHNVREVAMPQPAAVPTQPVVKSAQPKQQVDEAMEKEKRAESPRTLVNGQYWIRAVANPNFHKYLQTSPENTPGVSVMKSAATARQFNVVGGQLVSFSPEGSKPLYMNVEKPDDFTQRKLATWLNTTENVFGTFAFSGDALTWTAPQVKRQNLAAWLVCGNQELFINTGAYAYNTPAGCADQTIHYYNGATANE